MPNTVPTVDLNFWANAALVGAVTFGVLYILSRV